MHAPNCTLPAPHARLFSVWDKLALMSACVWVQVFLFSVFDGHAGSRAAEEAGAQLHGLVEARLLAAEQPSEGAGDEVASALESAIGELDARLLARGEAAGSTAGVRARVQLLWSPGPRPSPVFRSVLCDCLSLNVPMLSAAAEPAEAACARSQDARPAGRAARALGRDA